MKRHLQTACALLVLLASACDEGVKDAAKALNEAAHGIGIVQQVAIDAEKSKLITMAEARTVIQGTMKLSEVGKSAVAVLKAVNDQEPASRTRAIDALGVVADELARLQQSVKITNATARHQIEAGFLLVQTSLNSARVILASQ